ncbi:MAG TPA: protein kinase [Vicinamibacterales bacterium]|nr:protein kinase [Vicinamibacterales bacterium]
MIGRTLSHYTLVSELGRGGMGVVYRAIDVTLGREVAIKVLLPEFVADPERRHRFVQEARAAAALEHPHIGAVYEVDEADGMTFIAMELIRGERLKEVLARSGLSSSRAIQLAVEIAEALGKAHDKGIVHRDLTPSNVVITEDGHAKVIDFGLAKLVEPIAGPTSEAETRARTGSGLVMGTTAYMSPEQARGRPADHRSDVFSLGLVLFKMLSGDLAFNGPSGAETLNAIINQPDPPLKLSFEGEPAIELRRIVHKCLAKDPRDRYQTMKDLAVDLREAARRLDATSTAPVTAVRSGTTRARHWIPFAVVAAILAIVAGYGWYRAHGSATAPVETARKRIAVLPFQNLGAPEDEDFAAGVSEEIMSRLSAVSRLAVISRNSVLPYKKTDKSSRDIGKELDVDYLVVGTVRWQPAKDGPGRVRVTPQLIHVADDTQVWSDTYERGFEEVFAVQSDIATHVIQELNIAVLALEQTIIKGRPMPNFEAYREYLRGYYTAYHAPRPDSREALQHFERAVALDPGFAAGHAAVANMAATMFFYDEATSALEDKGNRAIERALAIDPNLADAYLARGTFLWSQPHGFAHEPALREYHRALALNPSLAEGRVAIARIYEHIGLLDEAREQLTQALALDPAAATARGRIELTYLWQHDYQRVAEIARSAAPSWFKVEMLSYLGQDQAARDLAATLAPNPWVPNMSSGFNIVLMAKLGQHEGVKAALPVLENLARNPRGLSHFHHAQYSLGLAHALLGHKREAVSWLRMAAAQGFPCYPFYAKDPNLSGLKGDPDFEAFMAELKAQWEQLRIEAAKHS